MLVGMKKPANPETELQAAVTDLSLAVGQILRRLRTEGNPDALSLSQLGALARLDKNGPMTNADLARAEAMKPQSMSAILVGLEQEGFVERRPHPTDGRQILFAISQAGAEMRRQRGIAKRHWLTAAISELDPADFRTLVAALPVIKRLSES
jgi:DNA-binding MarR family transcriptional regulator